MSVDASEKPLEPGLTLLLSLFRLLQMVKIHLANNKLVVDSFAEFRQALSLICQTADSANIRLNRGRFYLNQERLNFPPGLAATVGKLAEYLQARGIVGLRFFDQEGLSDDGIIFFIRLINQAGREKDPLAWLQIECDKAKLTWVELMTDPRDAQIAGDGGGGSSAPQTTENRTQEPEVINLGDSVKSNDGDKSSDSVKQNDGGKSSDGDNPSDGLDLDGLDLSGLDLGGLDLSEGGGGETKDGGGGDGGGGDGEAGGGPAANRPAASPILDLTKTAFRQIMASTARATYSHALTSILDMTGHQQAVQKRVGLQKSKRVVQSLIDLLAKD